jgi:hypothetical protein
MMMFSQAQVEGLIRTVMLLLSGFAVAYGIDNATWATVTGAVVALAGAFWSVSSNSVSSLVSGAAESPQVTQVVMKSSKDSDAIPSAKVISHEP